MGAIKENIKGHIQKHESAWKVYVKLRNIKDIYKEEIKFYVKNGLRRIGLYPVDKCLASLKDKHKGEKIFVLATGPSLTLEDIEMIKNSGVTTISMNGIFKIYDKTDWRPDYYILGDYWLAKKYLRMYPDLHMDMMAKKMTILTDQCKPIFPYTENFDNVAFLTENWLDHWFNHESKRFHYNRDIRYGVYDMFTVAITAVNLADYLGASEVYLVGADCDYAQPKAHVGESEKNVKMTESYIRGQEKHTQIMLRSYGELGKRLRKDITVYNATRGGRLEVFERKMLEEALGDCKHG